MTWLGRGLRGIDGDRWAVDLPHTRTWRMDRRVESLSLPVATCKLHLFAFRLLAAFVASIFVRLGPHPPSLVRIVQPACTRSSVEWHRFWKGPRLVPRLSSLPSSRPLHPRCAIPSRFESRSILSRLVISQLALPPRPIPDRKGRLDRDTDRPEGNETGFEGREIDPFEKETRRGIERRGQRERVPSARRERWPWTSRRGKRVRGGGKKGGWRGTRRFTDQEADAWTPRRTSQMHWCECSTSTKPPPTHMEMETPTKCSCSTDTAGTSSRRFCE